MTARRVGAVFALLGSALVVVSNLGFGSYSHGAFVPLVGFTVAALVPYVVLYGVSRSLTNAWAVAGAGLAAVVVEAGIRASVFLFPRGSPMRATCARRRATVVGKRSGRPNPMKTSTLAAAVTAAMVSRPANPTLGQRPPAK